MKILQICSAPISFLGGMERVVLKLSKELSKNHEVTILQTDLYEPNTPHKKEEFVGKIKVITCKNDFFMKGYGYSSEFKKTLKSIWKDYDVVHIHGFGRFTSSYSLKFLKNKIPTIFTAHGFFHTKENSLIKKLHNVYFKNLICNANYCTALTDLEVKIYRNLGVKEDHIKVVPNGINLKDYSKKFDKKSLNKKYLEGLDLNLPILTFVGRLHKSKGVDSILKAIKPLNTNFLIIGKDAGAKKDLLELSNKLEIDHRVKFLDNVSDEDLAGLYSLSDLFILYSEWEGFGIVLLEAMASGTPVIVRNKGAMPYLVKNGWNGYVVDSEENLKNRIEYILSDKKELVELGKNSKEFTKDYDWKNVTNKYLELYSKTD